MSRYDNWCGLPVWSPIVVDVEGMQHDRVQPVPPPLRRAELARRPECDSYISRLIEKQKWDRFQKLLEKRCGDPEAESKLESALSNLVEL